MITPTTQHAFDAFNYGVAFNADTDFATCGLHEEIARKRYAIYDHDDDPIWTITSNFTNSERRRFIKGVIEIVKKYAPDAPSLEEYIKGEVEI